VWSFERTALDYQRGASVMAGHEIENMKGRVKEAVGDITGNKSLKREGRLDQASAGTKKAIDTVADKAKSIVSRKK
jgi:uncharacterized protein YjbJ (UPF0337 family)